MKQPNSLHVDTNSQKLKVDQNFFWLGMIKNGCCQSGLWTLKLTVSLELTDFVHSGTNSHKLKDD